MKMNKDNIIATQEKLIENQKQIIAAQKTMLRLYEEKINILKAQYKELEDFIKCSL